MNALLNTHCNSQSIAVVINIRMGSASLSRIFKLSDQNVHFFHRLIQHCVLIPVSLSIVAVFIRLGHITYDLR